LREWKNRQRSGRPKRKRSPSIKGWKKKRLYSDITMKVEKEEQPFFLWLEEEEQG
jgi:hypothetical protein